MDSNFHFMPQMLKSALCEEPHEPGCDAQGDGLL